MSNLVVITFENEEEAGKVREAVRKLRNQSLLKLDDSAVVVKDAEGKVTVDNEMDRGVKVGAISGGIVGVLLGSIFFPLGGLLLGALGGAVVSAASVVKDIQDAMHPGTSAIFLIVRDADADAAIAALRPFKGALFHTSMSTQAEENLRRVLKDRT